MSPRRFHFSKLLHRIIEVPTEEQDPAARRRFAARELDPPRPTPERVHARKDLEVLHRLSDREIRLAPEIQRRAIQVARLHLRLRRARAALADALTAFHRDSSV
jgi:hypothetical protein